ncbi:hypothetical protein Ddye_011107 [Dipteronia dyeriana]|uniref:DUF7356 domain-containing protein n=1 Tax=Dipteronia dyeriana TaxID=168575 RepID=A0AAD9XEW4_9ROSI|nr:hypothetical protein Ddye_011107 [Dipteronia dyeriana]
MDRNEILAVFLLCLIVADVSNARFRDLETNESATPVSNSNNELDRKPIGADKSNETKSKEVRTPSNSTQLDPKPLNRTNLKSPDLTTEGTDNGRNSGDTNSGSPLVETGKIDKEKNPKGLNTSHTGVGSHPVDNANTDNGKNSKSSNSTDSTMSPPGNGTNPGDSNAGKNLTTSHGDGTKEKNNGDNNSSDLGVDETCMGLTNNCTINTHMLVACIKSFDEGSGNLSVLVQNEGEKTLRVKLTFPSAVENPTKQLKVFKHQTQMINILLAVGESPKVRLNTENEECLLHIAPLESEENAFLHLPSYDKLATPINGAYFLISSVLIFGGTWACCKFRKRKRHDGVPYQELEMGLPDTASAVTVESAEGWDQGWDDDWDEENSVKSPGAPRVGNISVNGLTSRSSNKDGWENDWDD